ncbi:MAG: electron transfer flavoprotein subunit beta/FixA family protein [Streptosporangiaceae bacterium]
MPMQMLACVKRVPQVGGKITVTADGQDVDARNTGFTISPHEECAVEAAVQLAERLGGSVTVLTLGPPEAEAQLRDMLALGASRAVLLETDGREWGPVATAAAIAAEARDGGYDLLLFGNEAADTGGYQVGIRVAHALGLPCATGIKDLEVAADGGRARARREYRGVQEAYDLPLPAVITVKEGINLPRYPSLPGRLRARRAPVERRQPQWAADGLRKRALRVPAAERKQAQVLGAGTDAVPALVALLAELGVLS